MPDLALISLLITVAVGATGYMQLLINRATMAGARPFLTVDRVTVSSSGIDLVIKNVGSVPAGDISVSVSSQHQASSEFRLDGLAAGASAEFSLVSCQSSWIELSLDYGDLTGRRFQGVRRLEGQGQAAFRIATSSEPRADSPRLIGPLRIAALL